jgi:hypothetical protein
MGRDINIRRKKAKELTQSYTENHRGSQRLII